MSITVVCLSLLIGQNLNPFTIRSHALATARQCTMLNIQSLAMLLYHCVWFQRMPIQRQSRACMRKISLYCDPPLRTHRHRSICPSPFIVIMVAKEVRFSLCQTAANYDYWVIFRSTNWASFDNLTDFNTIAYPSIEAHSVATDSTLKAQQESVAIYGVATWKKTLCPQTYHKGELAFNYVYITNRTNSDFRRATDAVSDHAFSLYLVLCRLIRRTEKS